MTWQYVHVTSLRVSSLSLGEMNGTQPLDSRATVDQLLVHQQPVVVQIERGAPKTCLKKPSIATFLWSEWHTMHILFADTKVGMADIVKIDRTVPKE